MSPRIALALAVAMLVSPALCAAQDERPTIPSSRWRVDVMAPRLGGIAVLRGGGQHDFGLIAEVEVRAVHSSGHGFALRGGVALGDTQFWPIVDLAYVHRFQLVGEPRLGLGLDLSGGLTAGQADDCLAASSFASCEDRPAVDGARVGGNAGATLVFHAYGFALDLDVRYRLLAPTERAQPMEAWEGEHVLTLMGGIGFGFW